MKVRRSDSDMPKEKIEKKIAADNPVLNQDGTTLGHEIWKKIKHVNVNMFALPNQTVEKYCVPLFLQPNKVHLRFTVSAFLPALEDALGASFKIELNDKYIVLSNHDDLLGE